jgi:threonine aldolase
LAGLPGLVVIPESCETNIVNVGLPETLPAQTLVEAAKAEGLLFSASGPHKLRLVTHLDASAGQCDEAGEILKRLLPRS